MVRALRGMVNKIRNQEEMWKQQQPSVRNNNKEKAEQIKQQLNELIKKFEALFLVFTMLLNDLLL